MQRYYVYAAYAEYLHCAARYLCKCKNVINRTTHKPFIDSIDADANIELANKSIFEFPTAYT